MSIRIFILFFVARFCELDYSIYMISIILGLIFIAFTVFAVLPAGPLAWGPEVISFLKGGAPVLAALIGLICLFIGAADSKDKKEAKKEDAAKNDAQ